MELTIGQLPGREPARNQRYVTAQCRKISKATAEFVAKSDIYKFANRSAPVCVSHLLDRGVVGDDCLGIGATIDLELASIVQRQTKIRGVAHIVDRDRGPWVKLQDGVSEAHAA